MASGALSERSDDVAATSTSTIAEGFGWVEAPLVVGPGEVMFASLNRGEIARSSNGSVSTIVTSQGGPVAMASHPNGETYVLQLSGQFGSPDGCPGGLYRLSDGALVPVHLDQLSVPVDMCVGPDGALYISDAVSEEALDEPVEGCLWRYRIEDDSLELVRGGLYFPNGVLFDAGGELAFVAETQGRQISVLDARMGFQTAQRWAIENGQPDGLALDSAGLLYACVPAADEVTVLDARDGSRRGGIPCGKGSYPTNCCFSHDGKALFVSCAGNGTLIEVSLN